MSEREERYIQGFGGETGDKQAKLRTYAYMRG
jgi:hypothetical protein